MKKSRQWTALFGRISCALGLVLLGALSTYLMMRSGPAPLAEPADTATDPLVPLVSVARQSLTEQLTVLGTVVTPAHGDLAVAIQQAGVIERLNIRAGARIRQGQVLAEVARAPFEKALAQARATAGAAHVRQAAGNEGVEVAQYALSMARTRLQSLLARYREVKSARLLAEAEREQARARINADQQALRKSVRLLADGEVPASDLLRWHSALEADNLLQRQASMKLSSITVERQMAIAGVRNDFAIALAGLATAQLEATGLASESAIADATLLQKQQELDHAMLRAPVSGLVTQVAAQVGKHVAIGTIILHVSTTNQRLLAADVDPGLAAHLHIHDLVGIAAAPPLPAALGEIQNFIQVSAAKHQMITILIKGIADRTPLGARIAATIDVVWPRQVVIPVSAMLHDPTSSKTYVFVYSPDHQYGQSGFSLREVWPGVRNAQQVAIRNGLNTGEQIALHASYRLLDSLPVSSPVL